VDDLIALSAELVVAVTVVAVTATVVFAFRASRFLPRAVKVCRVLAGVVVVVGLLAAGSGVMLTAAATHASGFSDLDRSRMWSNGLSETLYALLLSVIVSAGALVVARWGQARLR
jgi:L-asparagine transporter-like permease